MWNEKMKDEHGNSFYKLGRTSSRESRISSYANDYGVKRKDIKFLYEVEFEDEVFAEKFLFYLLDEFRMFKTKELFKINLETIQKTMNQLKQILDATPKIKNQGMVLENFDLLMNEDVDNIEDEIEKENKKYIITILNGDYHTTKSLKQNLDSQCKPYQCKYCSKSYSQKCNLYRHQKTHRIEEEQEEQKRN